MSEEMRKRLAQYMKLLSVKWKWWVDGTESNIKAAYKDRNKYLIIYRLMDDHRSTTKDIVNNAHMFVNKNTGRFYDYRIISTDNGDRVTPDLKHPRGHLLNLQWVKRTLNGYVLEDKLEDYSDIIRDMLLEWRTDEAMSVVKELIIEVHEITKQATWWNDWLTTWTSITEQYRFNYDAGDVQPWENVE